MGLSRDLGMACLASQKVKVQQSVDLSKVQDEAVGLWATDVGMSSISQIVIG